MVTRCPKAKPYSITDKATGSKRTRYICKGSCELCRGTGEQITCPVCDGVGLVRGAKCTSCGTRGKIARPA